MGMPLHRTYWTADEMFDLPEDGNRYEVVHGELLVSASPRLRHQGIVRRLLVAIDAYLAANRVGEVFTAPLDARVSPVTALQPDIVVFSASGMDGERWPPLQAALLVVEVLSPSTARNDRFVKRPVVQEAGVPLLWIVDDDAGHVECWQPGQDFPEVERTVLTWHPPGASAPFRLALADLLAPGTGP